MILRSITRGLFSSFILLGVYFGVVTLISGWNFAQSQFSQFWYFLVSLALGFGIQIGLYSHLQNLIRDSSSRRMLAVTGTTSTIAMISCCAHYLANILPIIAIGSIAGFIGQYQVEFFWIGLIFNFGGIIFIVRKLFAFYQS